MKTSLRPLVWLLCAQVCCLQAEEKSPADLFAASLQKIAGLIEPAADDTPQTFTARLEILQADGLPKGMSGQNAELAYQAPDRVSLTAKIGEKQYAAGRNGQQLWIYVPGKNFGVVGEPGLPRFTTAPEKKDTSKLSRIKLPLPREQLVLLPLLMNVQSLPSETLDQVRCHVLQVSAKPEAIESLHLPPGQITLWVRETDLLPARIGYSDGKHLNVRVQLHEIKLSDPWPADKWQLRAKAEDHIEKTALSHLKRFVTVALSSFGQKIPALGPATGERRVVATEGQGRLEAIDGTRVLFLKGSPEEMGRQHGTLLKKEIRDLVDHILYGVGVGSSFEKGRWFLGEIELAQSRINPFIDPRYLREMDAIALATGLEKEEVRLANFFPELFHCSGFALFGDATVGGTMYHGRVLDYLRGLGLEQNAVVMVMQPDEGNAWVNVSYAGFTGSVTAMNSRHISIGEMGGRGEGHWDGKPMAQLVREVMERAGTLDEAVAIMRKGPRTCEYYYVIADGNTKKAVGIAATPDTFETVQPGQAHPKLPHAIKDAVLMSAGDRYEKLAERVQAGYGKFDAQTARDLMCRPVAMNSNIHSALFAPETLDLWIANADSSAVASHARYTHYNLGELLKAQTAGTALAAPK